VTVGDTHFWGDDQLEAAARAAASASAAPHMGHPSST